MKVEEAEEVPSVEELERLLRELEKRQAEAEKEAVVVVPQPRLQQPITITTAVNEEKQPSFAELAKQFEELASRLDFIEKAMTKGFCYHVKLPFTKDEECATVCQYHYTDEKTAKLLIDLLFKYYKHAVTALQALDELDECGSYPSGYNIVMFTDVPRLATLFPHSADLVYVFKLTEGEYPEIIRVTVDIDGKPRLRSVCRVIDDNDEYVIKIYLLESLDMPLKLDEEDEPVHDPDDYWKYSLPED